MFSLDENRHFLPESTLALFQVAVLGLCELIMHPNAPKPFEHLADKLIPYFVSLLKSLRLAYQVNLAYCLGIP